jgi:single-strand DNA-binding protein
MGNLVRDPETRYTQSQKATTSFTVACGRGKNKSGEDMGCDFLPIVTWGATAEACGKYLKKGSPVLVEGRIQTRNYDAKDGTKRYVTEIIASGVQFLASGKKGDEGTKPEEMDTQTDGGSGDDVEIPF